MVILKGGFTLCTAIALRDGSLCFGRNMDLFYDFDQRIIKLPSRCRMDMRFAGSSSEHYSIIGMGTRANDCELPLYADAMNSYGLCMAGLDFPDNAKYAKATVNGKENVAAFELIPWVLGNCKTVDEAEMLVKRTNIIGENVNETVGVAPLHWMIADNRRSLVVEPLEDGVKLYSNRFNVLTNNPDFGFHCENMRQYAALGADVHCGEFGDALKLFPFSYGFGALGLRGDASSASRFVKAAFLTHFGGKVKLDNEYQRVLQCFKILYSLAMVKGSVITPDGREDATIYSACMSPASGKYYFSAYFDTRIYSAEITAENCETDTLIELPIPSAGGFTRLETV